MASNARRGSRNRIGLSRMIPISSKGHGDRRVDRRRWHRRLSCLIVDKKVGMASPAYALRTRNTCGRFKRSNGCCCRLRDRCLRSKVCAGVDDVSSTNNLFSSLPWKVSQGWQALSKLGSSRSRSLPHLGTPLRILLTAVVVPGGFAELGRNPVFMAGFYSWAIAQIMKIFTFFYKEGKWSVKPLMESGGMPSSHSSLVMGVTTAVALQHGLSSTLFPICLAFSLIVMYDAAGVRRHAGKQAEVLNLIVSELFQGHPVSDTQLKELIGHTPSQVFAGALLGVCIPLVCMPSLSVIGR